MKHYDKTLIIQIHLYYNYSNFEKKHNTFETHKTAPRDWFCIVRGR